MKALKLLALPAIATVGLLATNVASAAPLACSTLNAKANGSYATQCAGDDSVSPNHGSETNFANTAFAPGGFMFVDKTDEASVEAGFILNVTVDPTPDAPEFYKFLYTLTVPAAWLGKVVDWVLIVKQGSASTIAYLFSNVTLGINGGYNSFVLNGGGDIVNDFSHASGLIRTTTRVPEPGTLTLTMLGLMLVGAGALRRRRRA